VSIRDLADQSIFLPKADCGYRRVFEQMLTEAHITPQTLLEFSAVEMLKDCLKSSQGIAMIPEITVRNEVERGELSVLQWEEEPLETAVLMIWHKEKWLSPSLRAFMETARAVIRG
jgi:DNA-binding transcriptional LysR family regulator